MPDVPGNLPLFASGALRLFCRVIEVDPEVSCWSASFPQIDWEINHSLVELSGNRFESITDPRPMPHDPCPDVKYYLWFSNDLLPRWESYFNSAVYLLGNVDPNNIIKYRLWINGSSDCFQASIGEINERKYTYSVWQDLDALHTTCKTHLCFELLPATPRETWMGTTMCGDGRDVEEPGAGTE